MQYLPAKREPTIRPEMPIFEWPYLENYWADFHQTWTRYQGIIGAHFSPSNSPVLTNYRFREAIFGSFHLSVNRRSSGLISFPSTEAAAVIRMDFCTKIPSEFLPKNPTLLPTNPWVLDGSEHLRPQCCLEALTAQTHQPNWIRLCGPQGAYGIAQSLPLRSINPFFATLHSAAKGVNSNVLYN